MRSYGRDAGGNWVIVQTDANGFDDDVWITTLIQALQLSPGESPFFATTGIPAQQSIVTQTYPDYYVALLQEQFSQYFMSLTISRSKTNGLSQAPSYDVNIVTHRGRVFTQTIAT